METKISKLPKSELEIAFKINSQELRECFEEAILRLGKKTEIKGFRKGKTPKNILKNAVSENLIHEETINVAIQKHYAQCAVENSLNLLRGPEIQILKYVPKTVLEFKAKTAVFPEIEIVDYKKIAKEELKNKNDIIVKESEINNALEWLQKSRAKYTPSNSVASAGNMAEIDFEMFDNNTPIEGGLVKNHQFIVGDEKHILGFEKEIIGMKKGEEKSFSLLAPDNYRDKKLRGKKIDIKVVLKNIYVRKLPELNDEFAKNVGNFANLEALKKNISDGILEEKKQAEKEHFRSAVLEKIAGKSKVDPPDILIKSEIDNMVGELKSKISSLGLTFDSYLSQIKKNEESLRKEITEQAKKRIILSVILRKIAELEKITADEKKVKEKAWQILNKNGANGEKNRGGNDFFEAFAHAESVLKYEKVFEMLENPNNN